MECLSSMGMSIATDAANSMVAKIKKHIGYLFKYKENLTNLQDAEEKLQAQRADEIRFNEDADRKQKDVSSTTKLWKSKADELHQTAQEIMSKNNISCLNLWSRYSTSKHASVLVGEIDKKVKTAPDFGTAFDRPTTKLGDQFDLKGMKITVVQIDLNQDLQELNYVFSLSTFLFAWDRWLSNGGFTEFESRASVVNQIWEALKDENVKMCSICGMGGTGKTTLTKKLIQGVESDHLFDKIAFATVSQNPDLRNIRRAILSSLGVKFESEELETSNKLFDCLMNGNESILLILDDVWEELDFEAIGLPKARLKILLTSRKVDVCQRMGSETNFAINVLTDDEARGLFNKIAMESIEKLKLHDIARKIADECGGLPLVIAALATALKNEVKATWNVALKKLQRSNLLGISGMEKVHSCIQLSYDLLDDKEARSCFRLCCLFPEDHNIPIEHLVFIGMGLELFKNVENMEEARDTVESIIHKLKKSFLLLDGEKRGCVKMHDILRDFAISISSKDKNPYIVGCEKSIQKWPETSEYENCNAISLICEKINKHPIDLRCPNLEFLQLCFKKDSAELPIQMFQGMEELKVLYLKVPSLLQPLTGLKKLRTLSVTERTSTEWIEQSCPKIGDLLGDGDLENLEILKFATERPYDDFPKEIGLLSKLRCLYLGSMEFKYMPSGILSKLVKLEELELHPDFSEWGRKEREGERVNASLDEIESLPLKTLKVSLNADSILPEKVVKNLTSFNVSMSNSYNNSYSSYDIDCNSRKALRVYEVDGLDILSSMSVLLRKCEILEVDGVRTLKNIISCMQYGEDNVFPQLNYVSISGCWTMEYLVDTIPELRTFFSQIKTLELFHLSSLIDICNFSKIEPQCFTNLCEIEIHTCPKLKRLFPLSVARELRQLRKMRLDWCLKMEAVFYRDQVDDHHEQQVVASVQELSTPIVETTLSTTTILNPSANSKSELICPTPNSFVRCLLGRHKQPETNSNQQNIEESIGKVDEKEVDHAIIFPRLKTLKLVSLEIRTFYDGNDAIEMPSLEKLKIEECDNMEVFSYGSLKAPRLEKIIIDHITYPPPTEEDLNVIMK